MGKTSLTNDSEFVVKEEKGLVYFLAFLFIALFLYGLIDVILQHFKNINYQSFIFLIALLPAVYFFQKGYRNRTYLRINKTGIFQGEQLVTGWALFMDAYLTQKKTMISIQDNFLLVIEYQKKGRLDGFRRKIPLTNTQNKSEEEVLEAITFFWKAFLSEAGK